MMKIINGDSLEILKSMESDSLEALVTDPPYGLSKMTTENIQECLTNWLSGEKYTHKEKGFMGKAWDSFVPSPELWKEVFRVLKPGAYGLVFAGSRTQDLMSISLRLAGFEVRDTLMWVYGSGFPKSHNVSLSIQKKESDNTNWDGWGTALKPAYEPIILVRKPPVGSIAQNVLEHGCGGINIDATRIQYSEDENINFNAINRQQADPKDKGWSGHVAKAGTEIQMFKEKGRWPANFILTHLKGCERQDEDWACAEGCPVKELDKQSGQVKGWSSQNHNTFNPYQGNSFHNSSTQRQGYKEGYNDNGGASRFFKQFKTEVRDSIFVAEKSDSFYYTSKASKKEKEAGLDGFRKKTNAELTGRKEGSAGLVMKHDDGREKANPYAGTSGQQPRANTHPTVKPLDLMRYLVKMVVPPNGTALDPFCGSGSTLCALALENMNGIGIELQEEYCEIAQARVKHWGGEAERVGPPKKELEELPLFKGLL